MEQLTSCVIFHSSPLVQLLARLGLASQGGLPQERQLLPEREAGRVVRGRADSRYLRKWASQSGDTSCTVPCFKGPMVYEDPETEGKAK